MKLGIKHIFRTNTIKKSRFLFLLLLVMNHSVMAQSLFSTAGDAVNTGGNCYRLTTAEVSKSGAIWYNNKIDLTNNFDISYTLNFGNRSSWSGGDGMAFILQSAGLSQIGNSGSAKGYGNLYDASGNITAPGISPSVVVEYDTYDDVGGTNGLVSLLLNGDFRRSVPANTPVNQVSMGFVNDGLDHTCRVTWNAATKTITAFTDGVQRYSYVIDMAASVFSNQNMVYFGFTAGTGGSVNQQSVCYNSVASSFTAAPLTLGTPNLNDPCAGMNNGSVTINFSGGLPPYTVSYDNNIDNNAIITSANNASFYSFTAGSHVYTVKDANNVQVSGNFTLNNLPNPKPTISASGSLVLCSNSSVILTSSAATGNTWSNGATTQSITVTPATASSYSVSVQNGVCSASSDITVVMNAPAFVSSITASGSLSLLPGQTVTLTASSGGTSYLWSNGATSQSIVVGITQVGTYTVTVTNNGCAYTSNPTTVSAASVAPVITVPADITVNNDPGVCGAIVNFTATETTGVPASTITYSQAPGTLFPVGTTTVTATATNSVGISIKTFNVTVTDNEKPSFTLITPGLVTVSIPYLQTPVSSWAAVGYNFANSIPQGSVITGIDLAYSAADQGWGYSGGYTRFYINGTYIGGNQINGHTVFSLNFNYTGSIPGYNYANGANNTFEFGFEGYPGWQGFFYGGTLTIHYTSAFGPKTVNNDAGTCGATVVLTAPPTSDNCGVASVTNDAPVTFPVGITNVTWTATDTHGNTNTITQVITVVDNQPPVVTTKNITVQVSNGSATITAADINNGSTDNCGIASYSLDKTSFNCSNVGSNTVTLTVTDIHGNTATATANVQVNGGGSPATVTANGPTTFCSGGSVTLTASTGSSYLWSTGETTPSITVSASGSFTVTVSGSPNCPATSAPTVVTVNPISTLTISPANPVICSGSTLILNSTITGGIGGPVATPIVSSLSTGGQTSAKLVVGLRKLVSSYTGPAIRLRRSSDNAEADFGFSGNELDLAAISTFLGGSAGFVTTLYDQSGNGGNITQTNTANQPTFVTNGLNGKPNMHMSSSQYMNNTVNYPSPFTVVYAARQTGPSRSRMLSSVSNNWLLGWWGTLKGIAYYEGWLTLTNGNVSSNGDSDPYVYTGSSNGSNSSFIYQNGTLLVSTASGFTGPNGISLNRSGIYGESSDGDFTEVYIFNTELSTVDRQLVENSAASYYSIYTSSNTVAGPSLTVNPATTTAYTINAIDVNGCAVANSVTVTVNKIDDQSVTTSPASICGSGSSIVTVGATQLGINYTLRNNANNAIVAGPIAGTGSAINFNTGSISATTTYNVLAEKPSGQGSLKFNGNNSYVSVPHNDAYNMSSITIEAMVFFNGSSNIGNVIMKGYYGWGIEIRGDGAIEWWNQFAQTTGPNSTAGAVPIGQWTHIAVTVGNGQTKFYVNGVLNAVANEAIINNNTGALYFGTQGECLCNNFDGKIDEIRIWNTVRTQAEIDANKTACLNGTENGLVSLFKFNDGTGTTTADAMGISNGILNNFDPTTAWSTPNPAITCASASCSLQMVATPTVTVNSFPTVNITADGPTTFCSGSSVTLTSSSVTGNVWSSGQTTQSIVVSQSGNYNVTATNVNGCTATSSNSSVTVNPLPVATITASGSTILCSGGSVTLTANAENSYLWSNGQTSQAVQISIPGRYTVTVTNANGCAATSLPIDIFPPNPIGLAITAQGFNSCNGPNFGSANVTSLVGGNTPYSVSWTGPNGFTSSLYSITNLVAGIYTVTAQDACGTTVSSSVTILAPAPQNQNVTVTGSTTLCSPQSTVRITAATGSVSYSWNKIINGITTTVAGSTNSIDVNEPGAYYVSMTDANGCFQNSNITNVYLVAPPATPIITAVGSTTFCSGGSVTLTSSAVAGNVWSSGQTTQSITVSESGNYGVTVTNENGCTASSSNTPVTVNPLPVVTISTSGPTSFCSGGSVTLTSSSLTGNVWSSGQTTQSITVSQSGNYGVTVTNANGCTASSSNTNVTENPLPVATISASGPTTFCSGGSVTLSSNAVSGNVWSSGQTTQSIIVTQSGNYSVVVTNENGCTASSIPTNVKVNPLPVVTINIGGPTTFCPGGLVILTSSSSAGNTWSPGGETTSAITVTQSGNYSVTVTNENGCSSTSTPVTINATDVTPPVPSVALLPDLVLLPNTVIAPPTATDNCKSGAITATTTDPLSYNDAGKYTIHWQYADGNGNTTTQQQQITILDIVPPDISCIPSITQKNDPAQAGAIVKYTLPFMKDNSSSVTISVSEGYGDGAITFNTPLTANVKSLNFLSSGDYNDIAHGHGISINVTVELFNPASNQWIMVQSLQTGTGDYHFGGTIVEFPVIAQVSKIRFTAGQPIGAALHFYALQVNLNSIALVQQSGLPSGAFFPLGNTLNRFEATDEAGNKSNCQFTVTVTDNEKPKILNVSSSVKYATSNCTWSGSGASITLTDNSNDPLLLTEQYYTASGYQFIVNQSTIVSKGNYQLVSRDFPVGVNTVVLSLRDASGNVSDTVSFTVTVKDNIAPTIIPSAGISKKADPGICGAYVKVPMPAIQDNCTIQKIENSFTGNASGVATYPVGTTLITWTVTDVSGNKSTATQTITVTDKEAPVIYNIPVNIMQTNDAGSCGAKVSWPAVIATDNCRVASFQANHQSGEVFPLGVTTVNYSATDIYGNTATNSFTITITDNEAPRVITKPVTITLVNGAASIRISDIDGGTTDNCGAVTLSASQTQFSCANAGINNITLTATDSYGNSASALATVMVIGVVPNPVIQVIPANTVYTGGVPTDIYLGYGPQSVALSTSVPAGNTVTYNWSGAGLSCNNCASPVFTAVAPGSYTFTVMATNQFGCTASATVTICVRDIRQTQTSNSKVYVCHTDLLTGLTQTLTLAVNAVDNQLLQNPLDKLGVCGMTACSAVAMMQTVTQPENPNNSKTARTSEDNASTVVKEGSLVVTASPNPSHESFRILISSAIKTAVNVRILDNTGRVTEALRNAPIGTSFRMGAGLLPGVYYTEVVQGKNRVVIKLIKQ